MHQPTADQWNQLVVNEASREINYQHVPHGDNISIQQNKDVVIHDNISWSGKRCNIAVSDNIAHKRLKRELGVHLREPEKDQIEGLFDKREICISDVYKKERVIYGTSSAVYRLLQDKEELLHGCHGVIIDTSGEIRISSKSLYRCNYEYKHIEDVKPGEEKMKLGDEKMKLGDGTFGAVDVQSQNKFVLKQMKKSMLADKEVDLMLKLNHVNITKVLGVIVRDGDVQVLQSYSGKSLEDLVKVDKVRFTEDAMIRLSIQALSALSYMHKHFIIHMDIKPSNVCVDGMTLHLIDFGSCQKQQESLTLRGLTPEYMSGELSQLFLNKVSQRHNKPCRFNNVAQISGKTDVYSWGLTMCFIQHGEHVMLIYKPQKEVSQEMSRFDYILRFAEHPNFMASVVSDNVTPGIKSVIQDLLNGDVNKRLTAEEGKTRLEEVRQNRENNKKSGAEIIAKHDAHEKRLRHKSRQTDERVPEISSPPIDMSIEPTRNIPNLSLLLTDPD